MAVVHPGNPDEQRENKRERERETGRWGLRERQGEAEGQRERERERDGRNEAGVALTASRRLAAWLVAWEVACVFVCLPFYPIRCRRACLLSFLTMPSETGGERERECERGNRGLRLAVRLVVRTKAWLVALLGGQVAVS